MKAHGTCLFKLEGDLHSLRCADNMGTEDCPRWHGGLDTHKLQLRSTASYYLTVSLYMHSR